MQPRTVSSAADALAAADRAQHAGSPYQLILSDVNMPEMDGYVSKPVKRKTLFVEIERVLGPSNS